MAALPLTLEELIERATDESNCASNDQEALAVANQVNREIGGSTTAIKILISKLQLRQEIVTLQTLNVLEQCVKNCGVKFHNEVGKYKFINELIKMLSPKYDAEITPQSVKERVIQLLFQWYCGLPEEKKIAEAYKMLKQQGIIKRDPVNPVSQPKPREKQDTVFEEEGNSELLSTLLASTNPDDLQSANKLIKTMVRQEEDRLERVSRRIQELETVNNNVKLLDEMLENFDPSSVNHEAINDLYESCLKMRPELFKLASQSAEDKDDAMGEILSASDELTRVIDLYKEKVLLQKIIKTEKPYSMVSSTNDADSSSLLDLGFDDFTSTSNHAPSNQQQTSQEQSASSNSLLDEQLKMLGLDPGFPNQPVTSSLNNNQMSGPQFVQSNQMQANFNFVQQQNQMQQNFIRMQQQSQMPLQYPNAQSSTMIPSQQSSLMQGQPNMMQNANMNTRLQDGNIAQNTRNSVPTQKKNNETPKKKDLLDFDVFSEFRTPELSNNKSDASKKTDIAAVKKSENIDVVDIGQPHPPATSHLLDLSDIQSTNIATNIATTPMSINTSTNQPLTHINQNADANSSIGSNVSTNLFSQQPQQPQQPQQQVNQQTPTNQNLIPSNDMPANVTPQSQENYFVPLEALKPVEGAPITVLDKDNLKTFLIVATDTRNEANQNVTVTILSTISTNANPVTDFSIQVAVPKVMRVKLQPATSDKLSAFNPILPPPTLTQIMLVANPSKEAIRLRFRITYQINGQTFVENSSVNNLAAR